MKIWEAIIYGILGGIAELLPISFSGHAALLRNAFHMSALNSGGGYFVRAAICAGVALAIYLSFSSETARVYKTIRGGNKRRRPSRLQRRSFTLGCVAFALMLCSLFFLAAAERIERLLYVILFFAVNAGIMYLCCRGRVGQKDEKNVTLWDMILLGAARMLAVFPGMSSIGMSVAIGRARGLGLQYNIRIAYLLGLVYQIVLFVFYLIRGIAFGTFTASILLPCLFALIFSAIFGYFAIQYFRYLLQRKKLNVFVYYCLEAAAVAAILALINA